MGRGDLGDEQSEDGAGRARRGVEMAEKKQGAYIYKVHLTSS